jgi:pyridinium-3,5-bisthiocarboxylic acid mononucleotide nickel chelatase
MRIAFLDCYAGIAGDMFLGALIDAGVPAMVLHAATRALHLNASLRIEKVDRSGITCTKVHVLEDNRIAEQATNSHIHSHQPKAQHLHKVGHAHTHDHDHHGQEPPGTATSPRIATHEHSHVQGRSLTEIRSLISSASLADPVKDFALRTFDLLGHAEARIHNVPVDEIHFHEVGAVDAIVDIVAASAGIHHLGIDAWHCSPLNVGGGMVECAHGTFPVPAPATADLLRGMPTYSAHIEKELVTPTGAALLRALNPTFGPQPAMRVDQIGYGAGSRNPVGFPNALRLSIGESADVQSSATYSSLGANEAETVTVLETALDDLSPQLIAHAAEAALAAGALDVMLTPVLMKKGRPGTLLTVLCNPIDSTKFEQLLLRETSTLGIRIRQDRRICLDRAHATVPTQYGDIRIKIGLLDGEALNIAPEFEDCRAAAARCSIAVKIVQQAAISAYNQAHKS